ncbi:MAG: ribosome maturation factor RimM [Bacteroidia bacterium]
MPTLELPLSEVFAWGRIVRAHGLKGYLIAESFSENPERYNLKTFWIKRGNVAIPQPVEFIHRYESGKQDKPRRWWRLRFAGVTDRTAAERWLRNVLYLPRAYLPPLEEEDSFYYIEAENALVVDTHGVVRGKLVDIHPGSAHDFFIVENERGEVFWIPAPFVKRLNKETHPPTLVIEAPEGLWDPSLAQGRP